MTDWSKLKVVELKEECKARGIPLTGLKLKQQYVDKLEEHEAENAGGDGSEHEINATESASAEEAIETQPNGEDAEPHDEAIPPLNETEQEPQKAEGVEHERPQELREEDSHAEDVLEGSEQKAEAEQQPSADPANQKGSDSVDEPFDTTKQETVRDTEQSAQPDVDQDEPVEKESAPVPGDTSPGPTPTLQPTPMPPSQASSDSTLSNDQADDERRRRKRSATPVPSSEEVARKKARLSTGGESLTIEQLSALDQMKSATEAAKATRGETTNGAITEVIVDKSEADVTMTTEAPGELQDNRPEKPRDTEIPSASPRRSQSPSEERYIAPAIHPATSALYIRNFKRPLHIPSLRSLIASVARSQSSSEDSDPITLFYLDSIRTHAFVSFTSVAGASRVRSAMHDVRYPNESMREPLFVDYVPNDKVQSWIDQETGGTFGGRGGSGRRFEVRYEERDDGVEAIFQEVDGNRPQLPLQPSRSSRMSIDRPGPESLPAAVHPDRAAFVPRESDRDRDQDRDRNQVRQPPAAPKNAESTGRGFKALDELFKFTTAKPKLYYKPVPESVAADRIELFRSLRVGYGDMGRSGDEGMKRYTFEQYKGRDEWVGKGPEFGFGKRGQDRLAGVRGRGGYRGRGDSWRGGAAR
ncbi:hypothetical protein A1O3_01272 [Capronia epimyces CBS 606.96]|uniref:SAP domain-containing protein n=1 Tax=Capronia epimyces CBS 606.96 TaxID=1182542 RepID=W9YSR9_9EURO|nr:uncharacterized protein A1O3_01272 [Capronia epimyces CBS 606.96]EXJ92720.1 hypothetical protein A1O3_01272 [Capronia epimyces CBS 606.96]